MTTNEIPSSLLDAAIQRSMEIAEGAPEKYQQGVFQVVLQTLLAQPRVLQTDESDTKRQDSVSAVEVNKPDDLGRDLLEEKYEWSSTKIPQLKGLAQYLSIIETALNEFKIDGLTAKKVQEVLFEKFRISKTPNTVSMTLMDSVGKYVDRVKVKGEYLYRITRNGIEFLRQEEAKT
ncbi:MAG: hypothetical protein ACREBU_22585 [Nitrososphaera sp.]